MRAAMSVPLAARQDAVVHRDQLRAEGISLSQLDAQLAAHRWQTVGAVVVVMHNGPLTERQKRWAAVLNAGPGAALCARTAAEEAGLVGWEAEAIEVLVPRGRTVEALPAIPVKRHESRRFSPEHVHPSRVPPQTWAARSVLDAATWTSRARGACALVAAAVQQRIVTPEQVIAELEGAGRIRHRRIMRSALLDVQGGAQALSEIDFGLLCRRWGLPEPERQVVRVEPNGRRRYLDVVLRARSGKKVVVEIDGAFHLRPVRYWDDMDRQNELTIAGDRTLRFPTIALRLDHAQVMNQVARALDLPACQGVAAS